MIHSEAPATIRDLARLRTERPAEAGGQYVDVPHLSLVERLAEDTHAAGWEVADTVIHLSPDGGDMAFGMRLTLPPEKDSVDGPSPAIAVLNGRPHGPFGVLSYVGVTTADGVGIPLGAADTAKHRAGHFDLELFSASVLATLTRGWRSLTRQVEVMRATVLSWAQVCELLVDAAENELLAWRNVKHVLVRLREPEFGETSAWSLLHAFAAVTASCPVFPYRGQTTWPGQMGAVDGFRAKLPSKGRRAVKK